jgi:hypothetical protein
MKKFCFTDQQIVSFNKNDIQNLTKDDIRCITFEQLVLLSYEQKDMLLPEHLLYFTAIQKKNLSINIITKSAQEIQKINLNALSDIELKSLLKHQIEALTYDQIINILPYVLHNNSVSIGTISNFRPKQYGFFTREQIRWLTMYQSANIPKHYLSIGQIKALPPPCFEFPRDTFKYFISKDEVPVFDMKKLTIEHIKYISKFTLRLFNNSQLGTISPQILNSSEMLKKLKLLSKYQTININKRNV